MNKAWNRRLSAVTAAAVLLTGAAALIPREIIPRIAATAASVSATPISGTVTHNFTTQGISSDYFTISGNLSTGKGTMSYDGLTLTQCLKMESATSITFTTAGNTALTLAIQDGTNFYVDSTKYDIPANGVITVNIGAGSHEIKKGSGSSNLFYIKAVGDGSSPIVTTVTDTPGTVTTTPTGSMTQGDIKLLNSGGWNEMLYATFSGISDSDITAVSYSGTASGSLTGDDLKFLVRDISGGVRVDIPGMKAGTYTLSLTTKKGTVAVKDIKVTAQDRSGYAHFNYTAGVGAYKDDGTLKANAIVLYVTNDNKNSVTVKSKDGTTVTGIGNILNSAGATASGKTNTNNGIIQKIAKDGTPLVIRIIGNVTAPTGLTAYDSTDYGGTVGDNGYMARMKSGKDVTIEGIGTDACINGWGIHFMCESANASLGKSFEVRNIAFRNVPEDCLGMEGVQDGSTLTAPVERCWIHNNEFYAPSISNPAESDKAGGDGACDFKRGNYYTNSYNYYESYHKTNLIGASDSNLQFHITFHHNYWLKCESRGPLARQANIHMYNNVFEGQTSYCQNPRADAYIFSEYNLFENCKNPQQIKQGAIKSFNDTLTNCKGDMQATVVSSKTQKVSSNNKYGDFDTNSSLSYIPSGNYQLQTSTSGLKSYFETWGGTMDDKYLSGSLGTATVVIPETTEPVIETTAAPETTTTVIETTTEPKQVFVPTPGDVDCNKAVNVADAVLLAQYCAEIAGTVVSAEGLLNAELDGVSGINGDDVTVLLETIAGLR